MKSGFKGFLIGLSSAALISMGVAFGIDADMDKISEGLMDRVNKLVASECRTTVSYGRVSAGDRCMRNEVMTGRDGNYIYCSEVTVDCFHSVDE